jgi:hypothetical protein
MKRWLVVMVICLSQCGGIEFRGNTAITSEELRQLLGPRVQEEPIEAAAAHVSAAYYDLGYLEVRVTPSREGERWVLDIDEGARFRLRRVQLLDHEGAPMDASHLDGLVFERDGWFARDDVARSVMALRERVGGDLEPRTTLDGTFVDLDIVLASR